MNRARGASARSRSTHPADRDWQVVPVSQVRCQSKHRAQTWVDDAVEALSERDRLRSDLDQMQDPRQSAEMTREFVHHASARSVERISRSGSRWFPFSLQQPGRDDPSDHDGAIRSVPLSDRFAKWRRQSEVSVHDLPQSEICGRRIPARSRHHDERAEAFRRGID